MLPLSNSDLQYSPCTSSLQSLPSEILVNVFIFAQTPTLACSCRAFLHSCQSPSVKAAFLLQRYGTPTLALMHGVFWRFFSLNVLVQLDKHHIENQKKRKSRKRAPQKRSYRKLAYKDESIPDWTLKASPDLVQELVNRGARIDERCLNKAVKYGHASLVQIFMSRGVSPVTLNQLALLYAIRGATADLPGSNDVLDHLLRKYPSSCLLPGLKFAIKLQNWSVVEQLLRTGAVPDVNCLSMLDKENEVHPILSSRAALP